MLNGMTFENYPRAFWEVPNLMEKMGSQLGSKPLIMIFGQLEKSFVFCPTATAVLCLLSDNTGSL